jgi:hypothetical protein
MSAVSPRCAICVPQGPLITLFENDAAQLALDLDGTSPASS